MAICKMPECGNRLSQKTKLECCPICRGSMGFWTLHRTAADIVKRRGKLIKYRARIDNVAKGKQQRSW